MSKVKDHIEEALRPASRENVNLGDFVLTERPDGEKVPAFVVVIETPESEDSICHSLCTLAMVW